MELSAIVDLEAYPIMDRGFSQACRERFDQTGVFAMPAFLSRHAMELLLEEAHANEGEAYFKTERHTVYLDPQDPEFDPSHARNRLVTSSKGCITDDQVPRDSVLRSLYNSSVFREFLCTVLGEEKLHEYADPLSSINIHYAKTGQELGWHFDNSSFSITLMIQPPETGGQFEYVTSIRNADQGEMSFNAVDDILDGRTKVETLSMDAGALVFFRGRNSLHRVAPNEGERTRMLAVLAYNAEAGTSLSEEARMTFYGRTG